MQQGIRGLEGRGPDGDAVLQKRGGLGKFGGRGVAGPTSKIGPMALIGLPSLLVSRARCIAGHGFGINRVFRRREVAPRAVLTDRATGAHVRSFT